MLLEWRAGLSRRRRAARNGSNTAGRELDRGQIPQRAVRPVVVVIILPCRAQLPCCGQTLEYLDRQELVLQPTVEALGVAVLPRAEVALKPVAIPAAAMC